MKPLLDDLSYKVQEMVGDASDEHDELDLTIERIKRAQSDKVAQFKQQIEQAEQIREKVLGAMEAVFRLLGVPRGEEYVDSAERQRQEQVFVEQVGRLPSLDPRIVDEEGKTDLHIAADLNLSVLVLSLLKTSPTNLLLLQVKDKKGATLLHTAAWKNACETAEVLLEYGADLNAKDKNGSTPLHIAAERDAHQTAEVLLNHGAQITARATAVDSNGDKVLDATPLHMVAMVNAHQTAEVLLQHGAQVAAKSVIVYGENDNDKVLDATPLHIAAERDAHQTAEVLLQHGADVHAKDNNDNENTPLHYAATVNAHQTAEVLLQHGAGVHARNNDDKKTPLHYAAMHNALETAKLLLKYGAKVNLKDDGWLLNETPLDYAYQRKADEVVALLRSRGGLKSSEMRENA